MVYVFDYMERVNDRDGIWKAFVYIGYRYQKAGYHKTKYFFESSG